MGDGTKIEWSQATWNPVVGCTKVSPGCDHCYAERIDERFHGKGSFAVVRRSEEKLYLPLKWRKPRRVFVNSMSDLFHHDVPDDFIRKVFAVIAATPHHTYQVLTKRHARMRSLLNNLEWRTSVFAHESVLDLHGPPRPLPSWPLTNVWLGVSVEDQKWADIRIPALLETPAAVRWLSCEPLLGPINLDPWRNPGDLADPRTPADSRLDWVVVGGESGPGARPMHPDWARSLRDQCTDAGVSFFFKQWGGRTPKENGRELDGRTWDEYPAAEVPDA
jgi:protein gp37